MPGSGLRMWGVGFACLLLAACEPPTNPVDRSPRRLLVTAVLDAGAENFQWVTVEWTESSLFSSTTPVSGATVTVTTPEGFTALASEESDTLFGDGGPTRVLYRLGLPGPVLVPGGTYTLHVRTPTGEEASGTTTIPSVVESPFTRGIELLSVFDRERDTVRLA